MDPETGLLVVFLPDDLRDEVVWLSLDSEPVAACLAAHLTAGDPAALRDEFLAVFPRVPPGDYLVWVAPEGAAEPGRLSEVAVAAGGVTEIDWRRA